MVTNTYIQSSKIANSLIDFLIILVHLQKLSHHYNKLWKFLGELSLFKRPGYSGNLFEPWPGREPKAARFGYKYKRR